MKNFKGEDFEFKWHEMEYDVLVCLDGFKDLYLAIDACVKDYFSKNGDHYQKHYDAATEEKSFFYRQAVKERVKEIINEDQIDVKKMIVDMIVNGVMENLVITTKRCRKGAN